MQTVNDFYKLRDTEDFFDFFGLEFDQNAGLRPQV